MGSSALKQYGAAGANKLVVDQSFVGGHPIHCVFEITPPYLGFFGVVLVDNTPFAFGVVLPVDMLVYIVVCPIKWEQPTQINQVAKQRTQPIQLK